MSTKVAIFGAGIAGLSAAHELINRGYEVELYEVKGAIGGKSSNQFSATKLPQGTGGRSDMPGEHGFRFFPGFYRNLIRTMQEIPHPDGGMVADKLIPSTEAGLVFSGEGIIRFARRAVYAPQEILGGLFKLYGQLGFTREDLARMAWFRIKYLTSGPLRRADYDDMHWWKFIDGDSPRYSERFRLFEDSIPRTMSALVPRQSSARVIGDIGMQFLLGIGRIYEEPDRVLMGPTNEMWIDPWKAYLVGRGVDIKPDRKLLSFGFDTGTQRITNATIEHNGIVAPVVADHYLAALPAEMIVDFISPEMAAADASLQRLKLAGKNMVGWMVGLQIYLRTDFPMVNGHMFYPETEWALTSISQGQFWAESGRRIEDSYGDGTIKGILSVIIADWSRPSETSGKAARDYDNDADIIAEVLKQLRKALGDPPELVDENIWGAYLDNAISFEPAEIPPAKNSMQLLIHPVDSWKDRPEPEGDDVIGNFLLASDYVRTSTSLASMESANEAARRAVGVLMDRDGSFLPKPEPFELQEEIFFRPAKLIDDKLHLAGEPHLMDSFPLKCVLEAPIIAEHILEILMWMIDFEA